MKFHYVAKDKDGKQIKGEINAESQQGAADALFRIHLIPISIHEQAAVSATDFLGTYFNIGRPSLEDIMMFSRQMFSLTKAGVPLVRAIRVVTISTSNPALKSALADIFTDLESGLSLSIAMNKHKLVFPSLMISLVSIGENTGSLDEVFRQLSIHFQRESDTRKKIKSATRYPIIVLLVISIAVAVINVVVIPAFSSFFKQFKAELPLPTRILIASSEFTINYWYIVLLILLALFMLFIYFINTKEGEMIYDTYKIKFPLIGSILKRALLARFSRMFSLCIRTGVPLLQTIQLIASATDNAYIHQKILGMRTDIEKGESLSASAKNTGLFTELVLQMMLIGEETGETDRLFDEVGSFYEAEVDYDVERLGASIEPILISVISGIVLVLALGVFLPMWNISQVSMGK
ncbi:MAG: biosis protein MshG [Pseudomonadota bacterium]|jgi:MSHA biogenesis protein MshG